MRVEYAATPDEAADAIWRWTIRTKAWARSKRRNIAVVGLVCASVSVAWELRGGGDTSPVMLVIALIVSAFWTTLYAVSYDHFAKRRIRKFVLTTYGSEPFRCVAELRQAGLGFTEQHFQGEWDWKAVTAINETERGIELSFDRGIVAVPKRAFSGEQEQHLFVQRARELSAKS